MSRNACFKCSVVDLTPCDRCGEGVCSHNSHTDVGIEAETVTLCPDCYEQLCAAPGEQCNTCGGTGRWLTTTEDSPTELVDLGPCPDCDRVYPHVSFCPKCGSTMDEQGLCIACHPADGDDYPVDGVTPVTESLLPTQTIYFDPEDDDADGNGWNVVDNGSVAARFPTLADAVAWCDTNGFPYMFRQGVAYVPRRITPEEIAAINENLKGWGK